MHRAVPAGLIARRGRLRDYAARLERAFAPRPEIATLATPDTMICRCEDVRLGDLDQAWSIRQAKLYTRAGMGACQGRICGPAVQALFDWRPTSVRPPIFPMPVSAFGNNDNDSVEESTTYQETR